jgi:hypothetical protein
MLLNRHHRDPNAVLAVLAMALFYLTCKKLVEIGKNWFNNGTGNGCPIPIQ